MSNNAKRPTPVAVERVVGAGISDHPFTPSLKYPAGQGCAHIVRDYPNSALADPDCCRRPECEHTMTLRSNNSITGGEAVP